MDKETIIFLINNLICFMCPGYISIKLFMFMEGKGVSLNKDTIIKSVVISSVYCYLYSILPFRSIENIELINLFDWQVKDIVVLYAVSVIVPFVLNKVGRCKKLPKILEFLDIHSRLYEDCYSRVFDGSECVRCIAYLKDSNIAYKGTVKFYSRDAKQIHIKNYTRLIKHGEKYEEDVDNDYNNHVKSIILDINMLERLELAKEKEKIQIIEQKKINFSKENHTMTTNEEQKLTGYPSIDKPWLKYYTQEAIDAKLPECTIWENLYEHNKEHPSDIAILYFGKKITYRQLFSEVDRTARSLSYFGVKDGDNVVLCMPAMPEAIYVILALNKMGANAAMLNPTFTESQLTDRINELEPSVMIVANEFYKVVKNVIPKTTVRHVIECSIVNSLGLFVKKVKKVKHILDCMDWNEFIRCGKDCAYITAKYEKQKPAIVVFSSGTTGASKGIQLSNDGINATISEYGAYDFNEQDVYFAQTPIWFSTGIVVTIMVPLVHGIKTVLEPIYDFEIFYKHIRKFKPNYLITPTGLLDYLMNKKPVSKAYKQFKYLAAGGEYVTPNMEQKYNQWLLRNNNANGLHKGYGMCECGGTVTSTNEYNNMVGSSGIPLSHVVVAAFDIVTGEEKKYMERGEIRVITPCRMLGYYKKPLETEKYFKKDVDGNVWACTGDMGYVSEDGNVFVCGRINDSYVNSEGDTIYLFDIERAVLDIEQVRQCKAVAQDINGEKTHVCHIVFYENVQVDSVFNAIKEHCRKKLPENHQPHLFRIYGDALPVAPSGKLNIAQMQSDSGELKRI